MRLTTNEITSAFAAASLLVSALALVFSKQTYLRSGPRVKGKATFRRTASTPPGLLLDIQLTNTGLVAPKIDNMSLSYEGFFRQMWIPPAAIQSGVHLLQGARRPIIPSFDNLRWTIDLVRFLESASDDDLRPLTHAQFFKSFGQAIMFFFRVFTFRSRVAFNKDDLRVDVILSGGQEIWIPVKKLGLRRGRLVLHAADAVLLSRGLKRGRFR